MAAGWWPGRACAAGQTARPLLRQPGGFEGLLPIGGYSDAPDLVVLDGDDGVSGQAQLEATAATLPDSGGDAHEPASSCTDEFPRLQAEVPEGLPEIRGPLQGSRVPLMPGRPRNAGIVLEFDVLVQIPKRLGLERATEMPFSETVESVAQVAENPKILFLQRVELGHFPAELKRGENGGFLADPRNGDGSSAVLLILLEHRHRNLGHGPLLRSTPPWGSLVLFHAPPVPSPSV